ncbi:MAG: DUF1517 domain-containing protein [Cyanobacteria bacterium J083]|nr:MAG: DUF1517 domain-containing protein [Cyanobacteria bacterium J083]
MIRQLYKTIKSCLKPLVIFSLIAVLVFSNAQSALAARTGGRIGGGSFRAPSRTYSPSRGGYTSPGYGYGGGIGFPFLLPFFGFGGMGSLFSILIVIALANFLINSLRSIGGGSSDSEILTDTSQVTVAEVQVGLIANARYLQQELNQLALTADTSSATGRAQLLQEATLALLRHPEYWVYGAAKSEQVILAKAEAKFNQLALTERSKFTAETLANIDSQIRTVASEDSSELVPQNNEPGEYIIVTIIVGVQGKLQLPSINSAEDLRQALQKIGSIGSDRALAVEILWTPQAEGDSLTKDDILTYYPDLKLV